MRGEQTIDLGYHPRPWQQRFHCERKRFSVLVVHRRAGKTVLAVRQLIDSALRCEREAPRFGYIAPLFVQAKAVAWDYLKRYVSPIPGIKVNESECWVQLPNGARIRIYGADNPDSLRGIYLDGAVLDEVAQMNPIVWGEIVRPALADRQGWALFIGTPKGINLFSELYFAAVANPDWYAGLFTCHDTGAIDPIELEGARSTMTEAQFAQEFLCDFAAGNEATLLSLHEVMDASQRHLREDQYGFAPRILGVDVARQGDDRSALIKRQGLAAFSPLVLRGKDTTEVAAAAIGIITEWKPHAIFVDGTGGYGAGVIDRLRLLGHRPFDVQFGGKASDERFLNKRAEIWFAMAKWIKDGACIPDLPELRADLCAPTYKHNSAGRLQLESKEEMKKRGLPSPDIGDALAVTFAMPVPSPDSSLAGRPIRAQVASRATYNPFKR